MRAGGEEIDTNQVLKRELDRCSFRGKKLVQARNVRMKNRSVNLTQIYPRMINRPLSPEAAPPTANKDWCNYLYNA